MDEVLAEFAAVVACGDAGDTVTAGGADPGGHGAPHVLQRQTVGDDLEDTGRSEEHTSELQSLAYLVCRLLLEKKKTPTPQFAIMSAGKLVTKAKNSKGGR